MANWDLLTQLVATPGVSGREGAVRAVIREAVEQTGFFDEIFDDALGNLMCRRAGSEAETCPRILLAAHMDQAGFLVSYICDQGFLRLHPVGTFDLRALASQPVWVVTRDGRKLAGTLQCAGHPVHTRATTSPAPEPTLPDFYVDLGLGATDVRAVVSLGDMVVFRSPFERIGDEIAGAGLDDRIGCWALIEAVADITDTRHDIICAFTVQEELGSRGAAAVAHQIAPDVAIICETIVSCAVPGVCEDAHVTTPGQGVALQVADSSLLSDLDLVEQAERVAVMHDILVQRSLMQGGGQDGAIIQRSGPGVRTLALGCPLKFMHASREHAHRGDVASYPRLIAAIVNSFNTL